ncbi:Alpha/Beta hydrolase protein [Podospora appendiculata]|uniref:Carboxylic ester hydrolase n=1 Tax=Podospora appendiculata TaxID=314037 RepID=A0AAE0X1Z2_9PEZI|nr:Alpha/Beta hydrolase protein [Podospora appendiculata]
MTSKVQRVSVVISVLLHVALAATNGPPPEPLAIVRNGTYAGVYSPTYNQDFFLGIPYAQDTTGPNRFRVPQALNTTWTGTKPAKQYGHACPDDTPEDDALWGMSEDCLSINIVRPAGIDISTADLPILFWIHGGSYQVGTSGLDRYNLSYIVQRSVEIGRPVLGASINYRKGGWGFMYSIEIQGTGNANLALRDMRHALAWVQENIAGFGGDASRVTIWGESAGSFAVGQLLMSYGGRTDGLFHRSIQESGSAATAWYNGTERYQPIYNRIVSQVSCTDAIDTLACLRAVPYTTLLPFMASTLLAGPGFYPTVDGDIIPQFPTSLLASGQFAHIPHIVGSNSDEGTDNAPTGRINTDDDLYNYLLHNTGFNFPPATIRHIMALYPDDPTQGIPLNTGGERFPDKGWQYKRIAAILGDVYYHAPRLADARHYAFHRPNDTFVYRFNTRPWLAASASANTTCDDDLCGTLAPAYQGVAHATELAFVFRNPRWLGPWAGYKELADRMSAMWVHFAHDGTPNGNTGEEEEVWPPYASGGEEGANLVLQTEEQSGLHVEADTYRLKGREFLNKWARRRHV